MSPSASSSSSSIVAVFNFLEAGAPSSLSSVSALVRLDLALLVCCVVFDEDFDFGGALAFALDGGLEDVAPFVVMPGFPAVGVVF